LIWRTGKPRPQRPQPFKEHAAYRAVNKRVSRHQTQRASMMSAWAGSILAGTRLSLTFSSIVRKPAAAPE
jgi:hypothetical protein